MYRISLQQIQYFLFAAETLNFTKASERAFISQPALSKQIAFLEKELNMQLFERNKKQVSLTPEGQSLYKDWKVLMKSMDRSVENARQLGSQTTGTLHIGWIDHFDFDDHMTDHLRTFHGKFPMITTNLYTYSFKSLRTGLESGELDFIIIPIFELQAYKDVEWLHLADLSFGIAVPKSFSLATRDQVTLSDLKDQPFVVLSSEDSNYAAERIKATCRDHGFEPNIVKYVPNINSLLLSIRNGDGVSICHNKTSDRHIRIYDFENEVHDLDLIGVWKSNNKSAALKAFIEEVRHSS